MASLKQRGASSGSMVTGRGKINTIAHFASTVEIIRKISKPVIKYSLDGERIAEYPSIAAAARAEKVMVNVISSVVNGKTKSAVGYFWKLK